MKPVTLVLDISPLAVQGGQAVGILRTLRELSRWALANRANVEFVLFDTRSGSFRRIRPEWLEAIIDGRALVDVSVLPDPGSSKRILPERVPPLLRRPARWLYNPRRRLLVALERWRLKGLPGKALAERAVARVLTPKLRDSLAGPHGERRTLLPFDLATGSLVDLGAEHLLVCAGSNWNYDSVLAHVAERRRQAGLRVAFLSYDIIPLIFPEFFLPPSAASFRKMFHAVAAFADLLIVNARQIEKDVAHYCDTHGLPVPRIRVVPLGADPFPLEAARAASLPAGVEPGRYALFVSTIEPRKGHRMLFDVWRRLVAAGVPQATRFKLVFLGRRGWLVDDLLAEIESDASQSLHVLSSVSDRQLAELYRNAAFTLFPSLYEGYGLPVVESFQHGKAVIASNAGALAEVTGELSPTLDPRDADAWFELMRRWIENPAERAAYEAAIAAGFRHPSWQEAASIFFATLDEEFGGRQPMSGAAAR
jgi:glycosyltransferase involved in cell wall biosynthesis